MNAESILEKLALESSVEDRADGLWVTQPGLDVRELARTMLANEVRFITLTATPDGDGGYRMIYHWDVDGAVLNIATTVTTGCVATIADILPAADWVEREVRDYYALDFEGRAETPTLMLRDGDEPGLFSRTCTVGRDEDPAVTARKAADADRKES
jgi:NADH-quinone oxidoreductase subunit C